MASKIDIISNAFLLIGTPPINSLTDNTDRALVAANLYDSAYEHMLSLNRWRCAVRIEELARLPETPEHSWQYVHQLPTDMIQIVRVMPYTLDYEVYGNKLLSNTKELTLDYIHKPEEYLLPSYFVKAFEFYLAAQFCIPITENRTLKDSLQNDFQVHLGHAMYADAQGRPPQEWIDAPLLGVRF